MIFINRQQIKNMYYSEILIKLSQDISNKKEKNTIYY
jgi:hypothetical protein